MYFKKLEIFGFKSFADKTVLNFEPGVTAVVGPNGCGKSNVFDAIRWVLGEQSAKSMRGSSMDDVIFAGTNARPSLGYAEVSVTFDNSDKTLPTEFEEVTVTRRLYRSGKSEYLLNKTVVRLKDIQEMFMGTGVGAEAYSLVAQGRVDKVVSAKPEDRRQIFDEASGIVKYKAKKREALNKLKDTDQNLLRLNDIVTEVKRQIGSLERQAKKAQRYKDNFEKLKQYETIFSLHQMEEFDKMRNDVAHMLDDIDEKRATLKQDLEELYTIANNESIVHEELEDIIAEMRAKDSKIENQIELNARQIEFNEERVRTLTTNESRLSEQKESLAEKCQLHQQKIEELQSLIEGVSEESNTIESNLETHRAQLTQIIESIETAQASIADDQARILSLTGKQRQVKNGLTEIMKEVQGYLAKKRRLEIEHQKVTQEQVDVDGKITGITSQLEGLTGEHGSIKERLDQERTALEAMNGDLKHMDVRNEELEGHKRFLISQMEFVEKLQVQYDENPEVSIEGRFVSSTRPDEKKGGFLGKVKEMRDIEGSDQIELVCETKFFETNPEDVQNKISGADTELTQLKEARQVKASEIESQSTSIETINTRLHEKEKAISIAQAQREDLIEEQNKLKREIEAIDIEANDADDQLKSLKTREDELAQELSAIDNELHERQQRIRSTQEEIAKQSSEREEAAVVVAQLETEFNGLKQRETSQQENLTMFAKTLEQDLASVERLDGENIEQNDKKDEIALENEELTIQNNQLSQEKEAIDVVLEEYVLQKQDISAQLTSVRQGISEIEKEIEGKKDIVHQQQLKHQEIDYKVEALRERLLQAYQIDLNDVVNGVTQPSAEQKESAEVIEPSAEQVLKLSIGQEENLEDSVGAEQEVVTITQEATQETKEELPELDIDELTAEIETLKKRCGSFGSVNMDSMQEFEDLKERFAFLTKQQSDLLEAKDILQKTITKINRTTRQLFMETFVKVNEEFRVYYRMLFGGGEAELILVDPDDPLESGIDIVARPPGKKLQNINLLSGGEKTMTAIALIFAVFRVNPSPFCVLDEIDAALDEANVQRFATVLKEFAKIAQFIIITHNKKTIDHANVMYGVTMQETGVSRLVSVKLSDKASDKESESAQLSTAK